MHAKSAFTAEQRRVQILETATGLFAKNGFSGTTSAALARACGVSEALIYKLFSNKERLYAAMVEHKLETWDPLTIDPQAETDEEVLSALARQVFSRVEDDPDFVRLLYYSELQESAFALKFQEARGRHAADTLSDWIAQRQADGDVRTDVEPVVVAANFLCSVWHYAVGSKVFNRKSIYPLVSDDEAIRTIVSLFARGLRP